MQQRIQSLIQEILVGLLGVMVLQKEICFFFPKKNGGKLQQNEMMKLFPLSEISSRPCKSSLMFEPFLW